MAALAAVPLAARGATALRRCRSGIPAAVLSALLVLLACHCTPAWLFAVAPAPRARLFSGAAPSASAASLGAHGFSGFPTGPGAAALQLHQRAAAPADKKATSSTPWVGLVAPAALVLLSSVEDGVATAAFSAKAGSASARGQRIKRGESVMPMAPTLLERPEEKRPQRGISKGAVAMGLGFLAWYTANVSFNIVNKQALQLFPCAWTVSVLQLAAVVVCSAAGWASGLVQSPFKQMGKGFLWRLLPAALCHALGNGLTSVAFSCGSVSFTHVVKTSEPVWMALGNLALNGAGLPREQALALVPVMLGVALASAGELSFTWMGFLAALASTICFALRGIFSKRLMNGGPDGTAGMSPLNVYAMDSMLALVLTLPIAALADGPALAGGLATAAGHGPLLAALLGATGLAYFAYNALAFKLLGKLDVVSHAVGNLGKRIFVIGFSVLAFGTPLTARAMVGSCIAIAGSGLYSYVKATSGKRRAPARPSAVAVKELQALLRLDRPPPAAPASA